MNQFIKSLSTVLRASGNAPEVAEAAAMAAWKYAAGDGLKDHAVPVKLEERTLTVAVADAIWQRQLHSMRGQLMFRMMQVEIDEQLMKSIARKTDGKYFRATSNDKLAEIYAAINKLETTEIEELKFYDYDEKFRPFVWFAGFLLLLEIGLRNTVYRSFI